MLTKVFSMSTDATCVIIFKSKRISNSILKASSVTLVQLLDLKPNCSSSISFYYIYQYFFFWK